MQAMRSLGLATVLSTFALACGSPPATLGGAHDGGTTCTDTTADPDNCGACGVVCAAKSCTRSHCGCTKAADCPAGEACNEGGACVSLEDPCASVQCSGREVCREGSCAVAACSADADCAPGEACDPTGHCRRANDPCVSVRCEQGEECDDGACRAITCDDGEKNGDETDVDCGGGCPACADGKSCAAPADCASGVCAGGVCEVASCTDSVKNGGETGVDCGGGACPACAAGAACQSASDCESEVCGDDHLCRAAACGDSVKNGDETDVDCGGSCGPCAAGDGCAKAADCDSGVCSAALRCVAAACDDHVRNGDETDVDCGGSCAGCAIDAACSKDADCAAGSVCDGGKCAAGCDVDGEVVAPGAQSPLVLCAKCDPSQSTSAFSPTDGGSCGDGLVCHAGGCTSGCFVAGRFYAPEVADDANGCEACDPARATDAFSPADGASCGDGMMCGAGVCRAGCFIAGAFRPAGAVNPANGCETCDPATSTSAWSPKDGTACADGAVCREGACVEGCFIDGAFRARLDPDPANPCEVCLPEVSTTDWSAGSGNACGSGEVCVTGICRSGCFLGGALVASGSQNPDNACQSCQPDAAVDAWSPDADGTHCGSAGVCTEGSCTSGCFIAGTLHEANDVNPASACEVCHPADTVEDWSTVDDGTPCGGGKLCHSGACDIGCFIDGRVEAPGAPNPTNPCQACDPAQSTASWSNADGAGCGTGGFCGGGVCNTVGCFIDGHGYNDGAFDPDDGCRYCNASLSKTGWTDVPLSSPKKFYYTGDVQHFVVPECAHRVVAQAEGGRGGTDLGGPWCGNGASGGLTTATVAVTPGETLDVQVGGSGHQPGQTWPTCVHNQGGYDGGHDGEPGDRCAGGTLDTYDGGGGGGASTVLRGTSLLVGAGGGGGGGAYVNNSFRAAQSGLPGFGGRGGAGGAGSDTGTQLGPNGGDGATVAASASDATNVVTASGPANAVPYVEFFPDGCTVDGVTYAAGAKDPKDGCGLCDPARSGTSFVKVPFEPTSFAFTGAPQSYTVPACATALKVEAKGGLGGRACNRPWCGAGGKGGVTEATVAVTAGESLGVVVGGDGEVYEEGEAPCGHYATGGFNLGVDGALGEKPCPSIIQTYDGGGSGGATELLRGTTVLVGAAGGGGGGGYVNHSYVEAPAPGGDGVGGRGGQGGPPGGAISDQGFVAPHGADAATVPTAVTGATNVQTSGGAQWAGLVITPE